MSERKEQKDVTRIEHREGHVILPYSEKDFHKFLKGLLGKPESIKKDFRGVFYLSVDDIVSLFHLVDQRINQQNEATLVDFSTTINYDDGSSVTLSGIDSLQTYNEIKPVISSSTVLIWNYLVLFRDKKVAEKQEIQVVFDSGYENDEFYIRRRFQPRGNKIEVSIFHTARTWGADIESLLTNYLNKLLITESKLERFLLRYNDFIGVIVGTLLFLSSLIVSYWTTWTFARTNVDKIQKSLLGDQSASSKIDFIADLLASGAWGQHYFHILTFLIIILIVAIFVGAFVSASIPPRKSSHVLLSQKASELRDKELKWRRKNWIKFAISLIVSILCSVAGNWIFVLIRYW